MTEQPSVAIVVPCHNEAGYVDRLLDSMLPQLDDVDGWFVIAVNDASTDDTQLVLDGFAAAEPRLRAIAGSYGSPGGARSGGVAAALRPRHGAPAVDWILTTDADVELAPSWCLDWQAALSGAAADSGVGGINGLEDQEHLFARFPNAAVVSSAFGRGVDASEQRIGVTNLNGVNHAVRTSAYLAAGPYLQPTAPGPTGPENLAGEDWDLGLRLRLAGYRVVETEATVIDRGRRLLADVHAYVSGEAYEGAFLRLDPNTEPADIAAADVDALTRSALARSLRHFFLKPVLAGATPLDASTGLSPPTIDAMRRWIERWPSPTFYESRNGFVFGRLGRFADEFTDDVLAEFGLQI